MSQPSNNASAQQKAPSKIMSGGNLSGAMPIQSTTSPTVNISNVPSSTQSAAVVHNITPITSPNIKATPMTTGISQSGIKIIQTVSPSPTNSQQLQVKRVAVAQGPAAHPAVRSTTSTKDLPIPLPVTTLPTMTISEYQKISRSTTPPATGGPVGVVMASGSAQLHQQVQLTSTPVQTYMSGNTVVNGNSFSSLPKPIVVPPGTMATGDKSPVIRNVKRRKGEDDEYHESDEPSEEDSADEDDKTKSKRVRTRSSSAMPPPAASPRMGNVSVSAGTPTIVVPVGSISPTIVPMAITPTVPTATPHPITPPPSPGQLPEHISRKKIPMKKTIIFSRWTPQDDLLLKEEAQKTSSFDKISRCVKFSQKFTPKEIEERWRSLLYDPLIAKEGAKGMIHVPTVGKRVLWAVEEEQILKREASSPSFVNFQQILEKFRDVFHSSRTAKSLEAHFYRMKRTGALNSAASVPAQGPNGSVIIKIEENSSKNITPPSTPIASKPIEEMDFGTIDDETFLAARLESKEGTDNSRIRQSKRAIKKDEKNMEDAILSAEREVAMETHKEFGTTNTLALLRGKHIRYIMKTKEILLGRGSKENCSVDVNLSDEGPCGKISRVQGIIKIKRDACFYIKNLGKKLIFVNGKPVEMGSKRRLSDNAIIEIGELRFIFEVNKSFVIKLRKILEERLREEAQQQQIQQQQQILQQQQQQLQLQQQQNQEQQQQKNEEEKEENIEEEIVTSLDEREDEFDLKD